MAGRFWSLGVSNVNLPASLVWILVVGIMFDDHFRAVNNPPSGFIPSRYEPPNLILILATFVVMAFELAVTCWSLHTHRKRSYPLRVVLLSILNFCWLLFSAFLGGTRPVDPLIWHSLWLLLLEIILILELFSLILRKLFRSFNP